MSTRFPARGFPLFHVMQRLESANSPALAHASSLSTLRHLTVFVFCCYGRWWYDLWLLLQPTVSCYFREYLFYECCGCATVTGTRHLRCTCDPSHPLRVMLAAVRARLKICHWLSFASPLAWSFPLKSMVTAIWPAKEVGQKLCHCPPTLQVQH